MQARQLRLSCPVLPAAASARRTLRSSARTAPPPRAKPLQLLAVPPRRASTCGIRCAISAGVARASAAAAADNTSVEPQARDGEVVNVARGLVAVDGLGQDVPLGVRVAFEGGVEGLLLSRITGYSVVLLWPPGAAGAPPKGSRASVKRVNAVVPHPEALLGKPPLDVLADVVSFVDETREAASEWGRPPLAVMKEIPGVPTRTPITQSLRTGVTPVDVLAPIGRGQCMLVVGERGAGKTALALDALATQRTTGVKCVYVALTPGAEPARAAGANTVVVAAPPGAGPDVAFLTLCTGLALAEAWRDGGVDALVIVDDCSFADAYWSACSALVPAPVAQPGSTQEEMVEFDGTLVSASAAERRRFFSSFLQRAARLNAEHGGGSLTLLTLLTPPPGAYRFGAGALAAAQAELSAARRKLASYTTLSEEQKRKLLAALEAKAAAAAATEAAALAARPQGTVSRPIVEEFMSVSDGQVFLQPGPGGRFGGTWLVSPRDSVSRIGLEAAAPALRAAGSASARLELAQADDADAFAAGSAGEANVAAARLRAALQQPAGAPAPLSQQVARLLAVRSGACDGVAPDAVPAALAALLDRVQARPEVAAALSEIDATGALSPATQGLLVAAFR